MAHLLQRLHDYDRAIESGRRALTTAVALGDLGLQVASNFFLGQLRSELGDYRDAVEYFRSIVASLEGDPVRERFGMVALLAVQSRSFVASCLAAPGAFADAITHAEAAVRIAEAVDHPYSLIHAYPNVSHLYRRKGDVDEAIAASEQSRALCQDANIPILFIHTTAGLGAAYALSGRVTEALPLLEQAVEQTISMRFMANQSRRLAWLSEAYLQAGRMEGAMQQAQCALELSRAKDSSTQAMILRLLGDIAAWHDPPEVHQAEDCYRQAPTLAEEHGMRPLQAHCHFGLGKLYLKVGRQEQARAELSTAIELYRAMEMTCWLPQAESALARVEER
jgi:tetratricopeptide (TPR) repeat protein